MQISAQKAHSLLVGAGLQTTLIFKLRQKITRLKYFAEEAGLPFDDGEVTGDPALWHDGKGVQLATFGNLNLGAEQFLNS